MSFRAVPTSAVFPVAGRFFLQASLALPSEDFGKGGVACLQQQVSSIYTMDSRFLEPPRETKNGSRYIGMRVNSPNLFWLSIVNGTKRSLRITEGLKKSGATKNRDSIVIFKIVRKLCTSCEQEQQQ